jgi:hypothetical protein
VHHRQLSNPAILFCIQFITHSIFISMAPGIDYRSASAADSSHENLAPPTTHESLGNTGNDSPSSGVYYNARLDPKNYLEGPLSWNPATRLRQMLARPGIVVSFKTQSHIPAMKLIAQ